MQDYHCCSFSGDCLQPSHVPTAVGTEETETAVGSILRRLIAAAARTANAVPGDVEAETAHLLCRVGPQLLLRSSMQAGEHANDGGIASSKATTLVRERVRLALKDDWASLVTQCFSDLGAEKNQVAGTIPRVRSHEYCDSQGNLTSIGAQAATLRARTASTRFCASILVGGPPGPAADAGVKAPFKTKCLSGERLRKL